MVKKGVFMSQGVSFISFSHSSEDIEFTLNVLDETCKTISKIDKESEYQNYLEGDIPKQVWSMKIPPTKKL